MSERTIMQMEVDPKLIAIRKAWRERWTQYGNAQAQAMGNAFAGVLGGVGNYGSYGPGMGCNCVNCNPFSKL